MRPELNPSPSNRLHPDMKRALAIQIRKNKALIDRLYKTYRLIDEYRGDVTEHDKIHGIPEGKNIFIYTEWLLKALVALQKDYGDMQSEFAQLSKKTIEENRT